MSAFIETGVFRITPYSLFILLGALAGVCLSMRKEELRPALPWALGLAVLGGHLVWCLFSIDTYTGDRDPAWVFLMPWEGGYTLYGALLGGVLGVWISARLAKADFVRLLDGLSAGAAAAICIGRLGEFFSGQGFGSIAEPEGHHFFPLAYITLQEEEYVEWAYAVWFWEACAALILTVLLLLPAFRRRRGDRTALFFTFLGTTQILLEQFRADDYVRVIEFVRFSQLAAILSILAVWACLLLRRRPGRSAAVLGFLTLAASAGAVISAEFVFDKPQYLHWLYLTVLLDAALTAALLLRRGKQGGLSAALTGFCAALLLLLHTLGQWNDDRLLIYCFMAFALVTMGIAVAEAARTPSPEGRSALR